MVRLNTDQQRFITELKIAREAQVRINGQIDTEARIKREAAKQPVAALIRDAMAAGVPARQIAVNGLGYADVNSLKQYISGDTNSNGNTHLLLPSQPFGNPASLIRPRVGPHEIKVWEENPSDLAGKDISVSDSFGDTLKHGFTPFINKGVDWAGDRHYDPKWHGERTDWREIEAAVEDYVQKTYGKRFVWEGEAPE